MHCHHNAVPRVVLPHRYGCVGTPLPLDDPTWLWAGGGGGGGISTSLWRITSRSLERRIEPTAGSPVFGMLAVAAEENLNPLRSSSGCISDPRRDAFRS